MGFSYGPLLVGPSVIDRKPSMQTGGACHEAREPDGLTVMKRSVRRQATDRSTGLPILALTSTLVLVRACRGEL